MSIEERIGAMALLWTIGISALIAEGMHEREVDVEWEINMKCQQVIRHITSHSVGVWKDLQDVERNTDCRFRRIQGEAKRLERQTPSDTKANIVGYKDSHWRIQ
jgi:hypothetical protein